MLKKKRILSLTLAAITATSTTNTLVINTSTKNYKIEKRSTEQAIGEMNLERIRDNRQQTILDAIRETLAVWEVDTSNDNISLSEITINSANARVDQGNGNVVNYRFQFQAERILLSSIIRHLSQRNTLKLGITSTSWDEILKEIIALYNSHLGVNEQLLLENCIIDVEIIQRGPSNNIMLRTVASEVKETYNISFKHGVIRLSDLITTPYLGSINNSELDTIVSRLMLRNRLGIFNQYFPNSAIRIEQNADGNPRLSTNVDGLTTAYLRFFDNQANVNTDVQHRDRVSEVIKVYFRVEPSATAGTTERTEYNLGAIADNSYSTVYEKITNQSEIVQRANAAATNLNLILPNSAYFTLPSDNTRLVARFQTTRPTLSSIIRYLALDNDNINDAYNFQIKSPIDIGTTASTRLDAVYERIVALYNERTGQHLELTNYDMDIARLSLQQLKVDTCSYTFYNTSGINEHYTISFQPRVVYLENISNDRNLGEIANQQPDTILNRLLAVNNIKRSDFSNIIVNQIVENSNTDTNGVTTASLRLTYFDRYNPRNPYREETIAVNFMIKERKSDPKPALTKPPRMHIDPDQARTSQDQKPGSSVLDSAHTSASLVKISETSIDVIELEKVKMPINDTDTEQIPTNDTDTSIALIKLASATAGEEPKKPGQVWKRLWPSRVKKISNAEITINNDDSVIIKNGTESITATKVSTILRNLAQEHKTITLFSWLPQAGANRNTIKLTNELKQMFKRQFLFYLFKNQKNLPLLYNNIDEIELVSLKKQANKWYATFKTETGKNIIIAVNVIYVRNHINYKSFAEPAKNINGANLESEEAKYLASYIEFYRKLITNFMDWVHDNQLKVVDKDIILRISQYEIDLKKIANNRLQTILAAFLAQIKAAGYPYYSELKTIIEDTVALKEYDRNIMGNWDFGNLNVMKKFKIPQELGPYCYLTNKSENEASIFLAGCEIPLVLKFQVENSALSKISGIRTDLGALANNESILSKFKTLNPTIDTAGFYVIRTTKLQALLVADPAAGANYHGTLKLKMMPPTASKKKDWYQELAKTSLELIVDNDEKSILQAIWDKNPTLKNKKLVVKHVTRHSAIVYPSIDDRHNYYDLGGIKVNFNIKKDLEKFQQLCTEISKLPPERQAKIYAMINDNFNKLHPNAKKTAKDTLNIIQTLLAITGTGTGAEITSLIHYSAPYFRQFNIKALGLEKDKPYETARIVGEALADEEFDTETLGWLSVGGLVGSELTLSTVAAPSTLGLSLVIGAVAAAGTWAVIEGYELYHKQDILPRTRIHENMHKFLEKDYQFLAHDLIKLGISKKVWREIFNSDRSSATIKRILKRNLQLIDNTGWLGEITDHDLDVMITEIISHFNKLNQVFEKIGHDNNGFILVTNTIGAYLHIY